MVPTARFVRWIALGSPLWLIALAHPAGWIVGAAYLMVLFTIAAMDYFAVPGPDAFQIEREFGRFSLGAITDIRIQVRNQSKRALRIAIRDELPTALQQMTPIQSVPLPVPATVDE